MRKVIADQKKLNVVEVGQVNPDKYYGVLIQNVKGFMTTFIGEQAKPTLLCVDGLTRGNRWVYSGTYREIIKELIDSSETVYEFDTAKELFKWLAE